MNRRLRFVAYLLAGILAGSVLAFAAIQVLSRTDWGRERVRGFALGWLQDRVAGDVRIGRLSGGGLLSGVIIHDFAIVDSLGRTFVYADSAEVAYDWRTLLAGSIVLDQATLFGLQVNIEMLPGDTLWNFERVFPDTTPGESTSARSLIMFESARIHDGIVAVRRPWDPDDPVEPDDTARAILEEVPSGRVTVTRFEIEDAGFGRFIWESPLEEGKLLTIESFRGSGYVWRDPVVITNLQGTMTWVDSVISFDVPRLELPASRASLVGQVVIGEEENRYDIRLDGQQLSFADLQWLYPPLPAEGGGTLILRIQSQQPKGILFLAERARITAPGTQLAGTVGIVAGDTLYFTAVDLTASPLDLELIERLLPGGLPVEGLLVGTVEVSGPLSALRTEGDVRLDQPGSDARNAVQWAGTLDVRRGLTARRLRADLQDFDLAVLGALRPGLDVHGLITGTIDASGDLTSGVLLQAALEHVEGGRAPTRLEGGGTVRVAAGRTDFDLELAARTISFEELGAWVPALDGLHGNAHGPIRLTGSPDDLRIAADLRTDAGGLAFDGRVDRRGPVPRIAGQGTATAFQLRALSDSLPDARFTGDVTFDLTGRGLADLHGPLRIALDTASIAGVPVDDALFAGSLSDGVLAIDTLAASSAGVRFTGDGMFGIVENRAGTVRFGVASEVLESLEPLLFDEVIDPTRPRVGGRLRGTGTITGSISHFDLAANASLENAHWKEERVGSAVLTVTGDALNTAAARFAAGIDADSMRLLGRSVDSARVAAAFADGTATITGLAHQDGEPLVQLAGGGRRIDTGTHVELVTLALGSGDSAWILTDTATVAFDDTGARVEGFSLARADGAGSFTAGGTLAWVREVDARAAAAVRPLDFRAELQQVPFDEFLRLLNTSTDGQGLVNGVLTAAGTARAPRLEADIQIDGLAYDNIGVERLNATFVYDSSLITARVDAYQSGRSVLTGEGLIPADLRFAPTRERRLAETLQLHARADSLPASLVFGLLDGFSNVEGVLVGEIEARGTTREPVLNGAMILAQGAATWDVTGVRYRDIIGRFQVAGERVVDVDVSAFASDPRSGDGGGTARITGTLDLERASDPGFDLTLLTRGLLTARRRDMDLTTTGELRIGGSYQAPRISGNLRVDGGTLYIDELYRRYLIVALDDPSLLRAVDTTLVAVQRVLPSPESPFLRNLVVTDATIQVGPGSWLRSREMNVEVTGELTVAFNRQREDLTLSGTLTAVRGTYRLDYPPFARIFDVRDGTVEFPGTPGIDPNLNITAGYRVRTQDGSALDILAELGGSLQNPRVSLSTDDEATISESDLASYLFFGVPTYQLNIGSGALGNGGEAGSGIFNTAFNSLAPGLVASSLQSLAQTTGIVDYVGLTTAEALPGATASGFGGLLATTEIQLGRYITPDLFLALTQRLDSQVRRPGFRLEWRLTPQLSTELFYEDRFARTPSYGLEAAQSRRIYGFFLFREWGY